MRENEANVLLCADLVTFRQAQDQRKWYEMEKVNGAYSHGRHEKQWSKSLSAMSNVEVFATQDGQPAKHVSPRTSVWHSYGLKKTPNKTTQQQQKQKTRATTTRTTMPKRISFVAKCFQHVLMPTAGRSCGKESKVDYPQFAQWSGCWLPSSDSKTSINMGLPRQLSSLILDH